MGNTEIREILMNAAVTLVAKGGMEEASSRAIGNYAKVNSAYIYRYFIDKDDLILRTFLREIQDFYSKFETCIKSLSVDGVIDDDFIKSLWDATFSYAISNLQKCAFIYFFCNSTNYNNNESITEVADKFKKLLMQNTKYKIADEINLHICNNLILFAAMKVFKNNITDEQEIKNISDKCFELFLPTFKKSIKE